MSEFMVRSLPDEIVHAVRNDPLAYRVACELRRAIELDYRAEIDRLRQLNNVQEIVIERLFALLPRLVAGSPFREDGDCWYCWHYGGDGSGHAEDCPWVDARSLLEEEDS